MAPQVATIATLTPSKSRYQLTARATRIWEITRNEDEQPVSLDMVLLDQEGNHIHTTIPKRMVSSYKETLQEGKIYKLQHFDVAKNNRSYKPVMTTANIIRCTTFTSIIEEQDQSQPIPHHKFEFHPLNNLHERTNKNDYLIDVIGYLATVENKRQVITKNGPTQLRHIYIQDERKEEIRVTLWGKTADLIGETQALNAGQAHVVVITSVKVVLYEGDDQLQSTYGTKIYINLEIPEAQHLREREEEPQEVKFITNAGINIEEPLVKTIEELQEMDIPNERQFFICQGTITEIRSDVEWRYMSCTTCKTGLQDDQTCTQCNKFIEYPMQRYRLMTTLSDGVTSAKLVLFDKEAEKVIGKPINKLLDLYEKEDGKGRVLNILQECIGKQYTFKVKVGMSKFGNERELKGQKTLTINSEIEDQENINHEKHKALDSDTHSGTPLTTTKQEGKEKRKHMEASKVPKQESDMAGCSTSIKRAKATKTTTTSNNDNI